MPEPQRGMGRGLAAILSISEAGARDDAPELREIAVELITPNPAQPRKRFDEDGLNALAESLSARGVLQPVLVRPRAGGSYELVAGERRWRAARLVGLETIPALVQQRDDEASLEAALVENMAREDLNPVEAARAVAALVEELGLTREEVGRRVGRSRVAISNLLRLLDLPDEALALVEDRTLSEGHGRALLLAEDHGDRRRLARAAADGSWSVRVLEQRARDANGAPRVAHSGRPAIHPDQEAAAAQIAEALGEALGSPPGWPAIHPDQDAAAAQIAEALGEALGSEVRVRPRGTGYKVELAFENADEAIALAHRVRLRAAA